MSENRNIFTENIENPNNTESFNNVKFFFFTVLLQICFLCFSSRVMGPWWKL
uniref:Uncharacterized protein n=1 Tax=Rhizophora mucronata TaxID=61149 RepID=A0A2P2PEV2_RHIMU